MSVKTFTRRDSATSVLRKLGINPRDYDLFIKKLAADKFEVNLDLANKHVAKVAAQTATDKPSAKTKPAKTLVKAVETKSAVTTHNLNTVSGLARHLIEAGKTNKEVWAELQSVFNLDDTKRHYPSWFRSELKRKAA